MATTKYVLKKRKGQTELVIMLKYYHNGNVQFSTGRKVQPKYWHDTKLIVKSSHPNSESLNKYLREFDSKIHDLVNETYKEGIEPNATYIKQLFTERKKEERVIKEVMELEEVSKPTLFSFMEEYIKESETLMSRRTIQSYNTFYKLLKNYCHKRKIDLDFNDIDLTFYNDFLKFMYAKPYSYSINTAGGKIKILKKFLNEATERGLNNNLTFRSKKFKRPKQEVDKIYLNEEELEKIYKCDLSDLPYLNRSRDRFMIGCYTGLRYSDFVNLKEENFIEIEEKQFIKVRPQKGWASSKDIVIPLHRYIREIIIKYGGKHNLPNAISSQKLNDYLKVIGERAGIDNTIIQTISIGGKRQEVTHKKYEKIGTHTARRSFATNAYLSGIPAISIMKITGHKTESVFMRYICISNEENALEMADSDFFK
jgi:integrase